MRSHWGITKCINDAIQSWLICPGLAQCAYSQHLCIQHVIIRTNSYYMLSSIRFQAWHDVHIASTCAFNMWLQTHILKSMKSRIEAQARHNVHTASTCAYNTWLQKWVYNLSRAGLKLRLGTKCTWPIRVQSTSDPEIERWMKTKQATQLRHGT
jgi:hypothetical protein